MKQQKLEKLRLLNLIVHFSSRSHDLNIMKLDKLIYLYDQYVFKSTGSSATGLTYFTEKNGPAPKSLNAAILGNDSEFFLNKMSFQADSNQDYKSPLKVVTNSEFEDLAFTDFQIEVLKEVTDKYINLSAEELSGITHLDNTPYTITYNSKGLDQPIDLCLVLGDSEKEKLLKEFAKEELGYTAG